MTDPDPYAGWSPSDRLQMLAFEAELADLPRSLIAALWEAIDAVRDPHPRPSTKLANDLEADRRH